MALFLFTLEAVLCWALRDRPSLGLKEYSTELRDRSDNKRGAQRRNLITGLEQPSQRVSMVFSEQNVNGGSTNDEINTFLAVRYQ